jgi:hypothetical protein
VENNVNKNSDRLNLKIEYKKPFNINEFAGFFDGLNDLLKTFNDDVNQNNEIIIHHGSYDILINITHKMLEFAIPSIISSIFQHPKEATPEQKKSIGKMCHNAKDKTNNINITGNGNIVNINQNEIKENAEQYYQNSDQASNNKDSIYKEMIDMKITEFTSISQTKETNLPNNQSITSSKQRQEGFAVFQDTRFKDAKYKVKIIMPKGYFNSKIKSNWTFTANGVLTKDGDKYTHFKISKFEIERRDTNCELNF